MAVLGIRDDDTTQHRTNPPPLTVATAPTPPTPAAPPPSFHSIPRRPPGEPPAHHPTVPTTSLPPPPRAAPPTAAAHHHDSAPPPTGSPPLHAAAAATDERAPPSAPAPTATHLPAPHPTPNTASAPASATAPTPAPASTHTSTAAPPPAPAGAPAPAPASTRDPPPDPAPPPHSGPAARDPFRAAALSLLGLDAYDVAAATAPASAPAPPAASAAPSWPTTRTAARYHGPAPPPAPRRRRDPAARLRAAATAVLGSAGGAGASSPPPRDDGSDSDSDARDPAVAAARYRAVTERRGAGPAARSQEPVQRPGAGVSSDTDTDSSDSGSSVDSRFSTECTGCDRHIPRDGAGSSCDVIGCRATRCDTCMPERVPYLCRQHGHALGAAAAAVPTGAASSADPAVCTATAGGALLAPPAPQPSSPAALVLALPDMLTDASRVGVEAALSALGGWREDADMIDLADDLAETLAWGPSSTAAKGASSLRRFREHITALPATLSRAVATPQVIDIVLSAFVSARLRVYTAKKRLPPEWTARPTPEPVSVRGEVGAVVGLLRLSALLPADPRGSIPRTRRVLKKTGCLAKHGASPRGYTFLWELAEAWHRGIVPRNNPQAVAACTAFVTGIHFLLRPRYLRTVSPEEITLCGAPRYQLEWKWEDKTRPAALTAAACGFHPAAAAAPRRTGPALAGTCRSQPSLTEAPQNRKLPAKHPRISASQGDLLHTLQQQWRTVRGPSPGPLFCRIEPATQTRTTPPGATLVSWPHDRGHTPAFMWTRSSMSERVLKKWLVLFLTPLLGARRARKRVLSGLRGGGEMELVELVAPVSVRATIGWWVARRLSSEGALVTYEGCSRESMWVWTALLGTLRLRIMAPGVHTHVPHPPARSCRQRRTARRRTRDLLSASMQAAAAAAALVPAHAAPRVTAPTGTRT